MASGSFNVASSNGYIVATCWWSSTPNTEGNYSDVTIDFRASRTNSYSTYGTGTWNYNIAGQEGSGSQTVSITYNSNTQILTVTKRVNHNADGTCQCYIGVGFNISGVLTLGATAATVTLDTIPRASQPSVSSSNIFMGGTTTIYMNRASSAFTHTVYYTFNGSPYTLATGVTDYYNFTPDIATWAARIPNASYGTGTIQVDTYYNGGWIGSKTCSLTLTVPTNVVPTLSDSTLTPSSDTVPSGWGVYVAGKSKAIATFNDATGIYGSTITGYKVSCNGLEDSATPFETPILVAGTNTIVSTIMDSRGRTASKTQNVEVYPYAAPALSNIQCFRCNSSGVAADDAYVFLKATEVVSTCGANNTAEIIYQYKVVGGTYNTPTIMASNTDTIIGGGLIAVTSSYVVKLTITDDLAGTISYEFGISTAEVAFNIKAGGKGMGVGKYAETDNLMDVNYDLKVNGDVTADTFIGDMYITDVLSQFVAETDYTITGMAVKIGKQITANLLCTKTSAIGTNDTFCTINEGYRPSSDVKVGHILRNSSSGSVQQAYGGANNLNGGVWTYTSNTIAADTALLTLVYTV